MGVNSSKRLAAKCSFLAKDEQVIVSNSFRLVSKNSDRIKEDELTKLWGPQMDARLSQYINNYLFGHGEGRQATVEFERFAELFVFCTRGTVDERLAVLLVSLNRAGGADGAECDADGADVPYTLVREYVESVVSSYMRVQKAACGRQFKSWHSRGCFTNPQNVQRLAESLSWELAGGERITRRDLARWLHGSDTLGLLLAHVFGHLYHISHRDRERERDRDRERERSGAVHYPCEPYEPDEPEPRGRSLVPLCRGLDLIPSYPSLLDLSQIVFINSRLPAGLQHEWRFLFSSEIHGESFSTLVGRVVGQGPSVLVLEDRHGYMFGGFAPASWALGPRFYGDGSSFLLTLSPRMRVFPSTGYNNHYMYLNLHQQTMPNGLAMGGQHDYCGLWLSQDYGVGHTSESCTTYAGYSQMSHSKQFQYRHLEVWGVGPPPAAPQGERQSTSVLDGNQEGKALLELSGRKMHSEGIREPSPT